VNRRGEKIGGPGEEPATMTPAPDPVSLRCAAAGERVTWAALAMVTALGILYVTAILPSSRSLRETAALWHRSAGESAEAGPNDARRDGRLDVRTLATLALMTLQLPVVVWLILLVQSAVRRKDAWGAALALGLLVLGIIAALGWLSPPRAVNASRSDPRPAAGPSFPACDMRPLC